MVQCFVGLNITRAKGKPCIGSYRLRLPCIADINHRGCERLWRSGNHSSGFRRCRESDIAPALNGGDYGNVEEDLLHSGD